MVKNDLFSLKLLMNFLNAFKISPPNLKPMILYNILQNVSTDLTYCSYYFFTNDISNAYVKM